MNSLLFGTAGIPHSTVKPSTITGIQRVKELGLQAMEIEFVRGVNITEEKAPLVKEEAKKNDIVLTSHGQYWVNLNAQEPVLQQSVERVLQAAKRVNQIGGWSLCFHMAYYMCLNKDTAFQNIKTAVLPIIKQMMEDGNKVWLRPETGGKLNQFGDVDELIKLSQEVEQVLPCIDWAHHYARSLGKVNTYEQFAEILEKIEKGLGREALNNMHMHLEGIEYTTLGERNHVNVADCNFKYNEVLRALKEFKVRGVLISESPNIEEDALLYQRTFQKI